MGVRHIPGGGPSGMGGETRGKAAGRRRGAPGVAGRTSADDDERRTDDDERTTTDKRTQRMFYPLKHQK